MKSKKIFIATGIGLVSLLIIGAAYFLGLFRHTPKITLLDIPSQFSLRVAADSNFRQGPNQCGPYAAAMFVNTFKPTADVQSERFVEELSWRLPGGYTHPRALESLLQKQGIKTQAFTAGALSDEEKIRFLKQTISSGYPVILLTYMYDYQHYITLLGYDSDKKEFSVYDPVFTRGETGMTLDENGQLPGNRNISNDQILSDWSKGGIAGFYTWYLLSVAQ